MKRILVVAPNVWDRRALARPGLQFSFERLEDGGCSMPESIGLTRLLKPFDVLAFIRETAARWKGRIDGVLGTDDYLAAGTASALAMELGLPGPLPQAVLASQHKYLSRQAQRRIAPEATPDVTLIDPDHPDPGAIGFPLYVKPVRATCSILAKRIASMRDLAEHTLLSPVERRAASVLLHPFEQLLNQYGPAPAPATRFIGEQVLTGALVTLEGFVHDDRFHTLGITDSIPYPGTTSFMRFEYPSRLPSGVQRRMTDLAERLVTGLGLDSTVINLELFYDEVTGRISILEINPRMAYQFADLHEKVDGTNTYDVQLALATGREPRVTRGGGEFGAAASFVFRSFHDARVCSMPGPGRIAAVQASFPDAEISLYGRPGRKLSEVERGVESYRYAILNLGGRDRGDLFRRFAAASRLLPFGLSPRSDDLLEALGTPESHEARSVSPQR